MTELVKRVGGYIQSLEVRDWFNLPSRGDFERIVWGELRDQARIALFDVNNALADSERFDRIQPR